MGRGMGCDMGRDMGCGMERVYSPDRAPVKSGRMTGLAGGRRPYHNDGAMKLRMIRRFVFVAVLAAIVLARPALAQEWPTRPVLVVSPFTAGSANDIVARLVFDQVGQQMGQAFVVENRPGGGGIVGVASVVRAEPDGYTLLLSSASMSSAVILHRSLPYDELRDLEPIAMLGAQPSVLVAAPDKGFKTVAELAAAAKARPGELNFASAGIGSASHIAGERFRLAAGLDVQHIPYRGPVEALADLMTGRIDFYFLPIAPALPLIKQGKVLALAVSTPQRAQLLPDVPTIAEAGYPKAEYLFWGGVSAPAGISPMIVAKLNREIDTALSIPAIREKLQQLGVEPMPMTPEQFGKFFAEDVAAMVQLGKDAKIEPMD
jgi:tripartite-type tricarboxylate transporter receptor subunit TctC